MFVNLIESTTINSPPANKKASWFVPQPHPDAEINIFCFPFAGGNANYFYQWATELGSNVEVFALMQPGKGLRIREQPLRRMDLLIDELVETTPSLLNRPSIFFGHSMGAWVAYELCQRLPIKPHHLILSAASPALSQKLKPVHKMNDAELLVELKILGGTPEEIMENLEFFQQFFPVIRADFELLETHRDKGHALLDIPLSIWSGSRDPRVEPAKAQYWTERFSGRMSHKTFSGGHMFINPNESGQLCLRELKEVIAGVLSDVAVF